MTAIVMAGRAQPLRRAAIIDPTSEYRYVLYRWWSDPDKAGEWRLPCEYRLELVPVLPMVLWVMLNPSTADADVDDPTVRRCIGFTAQWGYEMLAVVNLYARRCTDPRHLVGGDPVGARNNEWIATEARHATRIIAAWGHARDIAAEMRAQQVRGLLAAAAACDRVEQLGLTRRGAPRHPLYLRGDAAPLEYFRTDRAVCAEIRHAEGHR